MTKAKSKEGWSICDKCGKSTSGHKIVGLAARCLDGGLMVVSEFEVAELRQSTGMGLSDQMRSKIHKMRADAKGVGNVNR